MGKEEKRNSETYNLVIKENYFKNLEQIVDFITYKQKQPLNAIKVGEEINKTMLKIPENPLIYAKCENLSKASNIYKEARYKTWLVVFKVEKKIVTILGVLSSKQKPSSFKKIIK